MFCTFNNIVYMTTDCLAGYPNLEHKKKRNNQPWKNEAEKANNNKHGINCSDKHTKVRGKSYGYAVRVRQNSGKRPRAGCNTDNVADSVLGTSLLTKRSPPILLCEGLLYVRDINSDDFSFARKHNGLNWLWISCLELLLLRSIFLSLF